MKNPLAYLKHIVKDPVTTIAEADTREAEILPLFYGSAGVLLVGIILQIAAKLDFMAVFSFIGLAGTAFCIFLFSILESARQRFESLTCDSCNILAQIQTEEDFCKYISFAVEKDEATFKAGQHPKVTPTNGVHSYVSVSASASAVVSVALTCPHCGEVKYLRYCATPLKCHVERKNVRVVDYELVHQAMETAVLTVVNDYNNPDKKTLIPYSIQSTKNPYFNERTTFKGANAGGAHPEYMGVRIDYRKDVEEMLLHYFSLNELNGSLVDPTKSTKKSFPLLKILKRVIKLPPIGKRTKSKDTAEEIPATAEAKIAPEVAFSVADSEVIPEVMPEVLPEVEEPQADYSIASPMPADAEIPEEVELQEEIAAPEAPETSSEPIPETPPVVVPEKKAAPKKRPAAKIDTKLIAAIIVTCVAVIAAGTVFGILIARNQNSNAPAEPTIGASDKLFVSDYVGYWRINGNQAQELVIHNGDQDSVRFSLFYSEEDALKDVVAQVNDNVAAFSMAIDGGVIKGKLLFEKDAITVEITQSTLDMAPVEVMECTEQRMTSWLQGEEEPDPEIGTTAPTQPETDPITQPVTTAPTEAPPAAPTTAPTKASTEAPTEASTEAPTEAPTESPEEPTEEPTEPNDLIEVPNVVGETVYFWSYAAWELWYGIDLVPQVVVEYHDTVEPDTVFKQMPAAGEFIAEGSQVTLYVSGGRDPHKYPEEYYDYKISNGEATITGVRKPLYGEVTLPTHLGGVSVTTIAQEAFIILTENEFGDGWSSTPCYFTSVTIPDGVKTIEWRAFDYCPYIETLHISKTVTNISPWAFRGCDWFGKPFNIFIDSKNPKYHAEGNCIIETKSKKLIHGFSSSIIPSDGSVTTIGYMAFNAVHGMENVIIPDCITEIEPAAFDQCSGLTHITIGKGITTLGNDVFSRCGFVNLVIPNHITTLEGNTFWGNLDLESVTIPDSIISIDEGAFAECTNLTTVYFESKAQKAKFKDLFPGCELIVIK